MPSFPSLEWMDAYATAVAEHAHAEALAQALSGRDRFVITIDGASAEDDHAYDLFVDPSPAFSADVAGADPAVLTVTAAYRRGGGCSPANRTSSGPSCCGRSRFDGGVGAVRSRLREAKPLLDCLSEVRTTFPH